jgi:Zn-dependent protease
VVDFTLQLVLMRIVALLLIASVHGAVVAAMAVWQGDPGPRQDGRFGLNPLRHLDVVGALAAVLFLLGWVRPVAIDARLLRRGRAGLALVVLTAFVATLAVPVVLRLVRPALLNLLPDTEASVFFVLVETVNQLAVSFAVFNLLPLPPLTGQHLLAILWPESAPLFRRAQMWMAAPLGLLVALGAIPWLLAPVTGVVGRIVLGE